MQDPGEAAAWKRYLPIVFFLAVSILFYFLSLERVIGLIGVENAYILIFVLSILGGLTAFSGVPYHIVLIAFAAGGLNPFLLGALTALGVMIGDSTSYYIGYQGRALMPARLQSAITKLSYLREKYPRLLPVFFLLYGSLVPLSNDVITLPTGFLRYPFWGVMIPLGIGNFIFNTGLALVAAYAYEYLSILPFF